MYFVDILNNYGLNIQLLKFFLLRIENFELFNHLIIYKNMISKQNKFSNLGLLNFYIFNILLINTFPVFLSIKKQITFNLLRYYLTKTNKGLFLFYNKPLKRRSRNKTFSKSTPKSHLRKRSNTSLWFKILTRYIHIIKYIYYNLITHTSFSSYPLLNKFYLNYYYKNNLNNNVITYKFNYLFKFNDLNFFFIYKLFKKKNQNLQNFKLFKQFLLKYDNKNVLFTNIKNFNKIYINNSIEYKFKNLNYKKITKNTFIELPSFYLFNYKLINRLLTFSNKKKPNLINLFIFKRNKQLLAPFIRSSFIFQRVFNLNIKTKISKISLQLSFHKNLNSYTSKSVLNFFYNIYSKFFLYKNNFSLFLKARIFRLSQSEIFLMTPFKKHVINYNLTNISTIDSTLIYNQIRLKNYNIENILSTSIYKNSFNFFFSSLVYSSQNFTKLSHSYQNKFSLLNKTSRKVKLIWVSKITQLILDPFRRDFMILYRKPFKYQTSITNYIVRYYRFKVLEFIKLVEFQLLTFLVKIKFALNLNLSNFLIKNNFIFINSLLVNISDYHLYYFDVVQLLISYRFILYKKWLFFSEQNRFSKFLYFVKYWRIRSFRPFPKQSSYRIPDWVKRSIFFNETKPLFLEINYLTYTCIILKYNYNNINLFNYFSLYQLPIASVRAYNWKTFS